MTCVIADSRRWNPDMAQRLALRTGRRFVSIATPQELSAERLASETAQIVFFPHWSHLIPAQIHERFECVIFHMTDLPFGRGGSPLQNLIARGIGETKISALRCVAERDAGPVYLKRPLTLQGSAQDIYRQANAIIEDMIVEILVHHPEPTPQSGEAVTFRRRRPDEGNLAGVSGVEQAYDLIRMLDADGYPPAFIEVGKLRLEFSRAQMRDGEVRADVVIRKIEHGG